jgi:hypothetical protein
MADVKSCRICLDSDNPQDFIAPCYCKGSQQFIHRNCLDLWRATNPNGRAFTHCSVCDFEFVVEQIDELSEEQKAAERQRLLKFRMFVARDTIAVFLAIQVIIIVLGMFVRAFDQYGAIRDLFPTIVSDHEKTTYYICGVVLFFAIIGLCGLCAACIGITGDAGARDPCWGCYGCYCGDCRSCQGGSDDGKACLVILVIFVVVLAFIGIFIGIFLATMIVQRIVQRHMRVLWLKQETKMFVVKDFYGQDVPSSSSAPQHGNVYVSVRPSAPAEPSDSDNLIGSGSSKRYPQGLF